MKRKITFFLTLIMLLSFIAVPANAAVKPPDASIQWTHILNPDLTVDFDGTTCIISASVQGQSTTSLEGSITISTVRRKILLLGFRLRYNDRF